jgi:precorrin-2 dehydrogenase/sirohydrochlorin ferrochelatase
MKYYPVCLDVSGRRCVIVGGGEVAERKVRRLMDCGAEVLVVSESLSPALQTMKSDGLLSHIQAGYSSDLIEGAFLVIGATDRAEVNEAVSRDAKRQGILVNIVDDPERCNFILPSLHRRGDLMIAVSTGGKSPALAKKLRKEMARHYGPEFETLLRIMGQIRSKIISRGYPPEKNKALFESVIDSDIIDHIREKRWDKVKAMIRNLTGEEIEVEV